LTKSLLYYCIILYYNKINKIRKLNKQRKDESDDHLLNTIFDQKYNTFELIKEILLELIENIDQTQSNTQTILLTTISGVASKDQKDQ